MRLLDHAGCEWDDYTTRVVEYGVWFSGVQVSGT